MEPDVREALRHLTTALENHLEAVAARRSPSDAAVDDAYDALAEAFERYEDALDVEFGEALPIVLDDIDDALLLDDELDDEDDDDEGDDDIEDFVEVDELAEVGEFDAHADEDEDEIDDLDEFDLNK